MLFHERLPTGVDDVVAHAHSAPAARAIGGFDVDAGLGSGASRRDHFAITKLAIFRMLPTKTT